MPALTLLVVLSVPGPGDAGRTVVYDVARLPLARALQLEGTRQRYRVALDSTAWEDGPTVAYDVVAPTGQHATIRLPALPIGHEYPDEFEVEGTGTVIEHPARPTGGGFTEYRIVGRMVRPVPSEEGLDDGAGDGTGPGLAVPKPDA
jgi:hypothetical protein